MANGNGVDWQKVATGIVLAVALLGVSWTTTRAGEKDLDGLRATHSADVAALKAQDKELLATMQEVRETTARLDERIKGQTAKLDRILEKLD